MKRTARIALFALLLAALPLRGYGGVLMSLCEGHHGGGTASEAHVHEHADGHPDGSGDSEHSSPTASICSLCASCCAGAVLAPDTIHGVSFQAPLNTPIPFLDRLVSGFVPEQLDRPPLPL